MKQKMVAILLAVSMVMSGMPMTVAAGEEKNVEQKQEQTNSEKAEQKQEQTDSKKTEQKQEQTDSEKAEQKQEQTDSEKAEQEEIVDKQEQGEENSEQETMPEIIETGSCGENATYTFDSEGTVVISGSGEVEGKGYFEGKDIKKVIVEEGITSIGDWAFYNCSKLQSIVLPKGVTSIGDDAFSECSSLQSVELSEGITSIGDWAFYNCSSLQNIEIPESVNDIGNDVFLSCDNLTISCSKDSAAHNYAVDNNIPYIFGKVPMVCTVTFDTNEGETVSEASREIVVGEAMGELPSVTRAGYEFTGWYTAKTGGEKVTSTTIVSEAVTVYAQWKPAVYMVTFDVNGGKNLTETRREIASGKTIGNLPMVSREGCEFMGWYTAKEGGTKVTFKTVVNASMTVYARWKELTYVVTFDSDGGKNLGEASREVASGGTVGELPTVSREDYEFVGWYTAKTGGSKVTPATVVNGAMTIYARWKAITYTVTFDANEGKNLSEAGREVMQGKAIGALPTASRDGYDFMGWYTAKTGGSSITSATIVNGAMTVYAQWKQKPSQQPVEKPQKPQKISLKIAKIKLAKTTYTYNGKLQKPNVSSVQVNGKQLKKGSDYSISYKNNKNIGTGTVVITGKGNYTGTAKKTFQIKAKKGSIITVGENKYKVIGDTTLAFAGLKKGNTKKGTVPSTVKFGGKNFSITTVAENAFKNTKITSVTLGENVTTIEKNAFYGCKKLTTITVKSSSLKQVGKNALKGVRTAKIKVPAKKLKDYTKLFKGKGQGNKVKVVKG